jgi:hypothetical protein
MMMQDNKHTGRRSVPCQFGIRDGANVVCRCDRSCLAQINWREVCARCGSASKSRQSSAGVTFQ